MAGGGAAADRYGWSLTAAADVGGVERRRGRHRRKGPRAGIRASWPGGSIAMKLRARQYADGDN